MRLSRFNFGIFLLALLAIFIICNVFLLTTLLKRYQLQFEKTHHSIKNNARWPWNKVYVMNVDSNPDLYRKTEIQLIKTRIGAKHVRYSAVDGSKLGGREGLVELIRGGIVAPPCGIIKYHGLYSMDKIAKYLTLRMIFKEALYLGYRQILIMEDGLQLDDDFHKKLWDAWNELPAKWDIVYLGLNKEKNEFQPYSQRLSIPIGDADGRIHGSPAFVIRESGMKAFLNFDFPIVFQSDHLLGLLQTGKMGIKKQLIGYVIHENLIETGYTSRNVYAETEYSSESLGFFCKKSN